MVKKSNFLKIIIIKIWGDKMEINKDKLLKSFEYWCKKLRISPHWDVKLEFVEDITWKKTGDIKIDCDDRKAVLLLNIVKPKSENLEEVS